MNCLAECGLWRVVCIRLRESKSPWPSHSHLCYGCPRLHSGEQASMLLIGAGSALHVAAVEAELPRQYSSACQLALVAQRLILGWRLSAADMLLSCREPWLMLGHPTMKATSSLC